jgi:predicted phage terminase large subunit-like protein
MIFDDIAAAMGSNPQPETIVAALATMPPVQRFEMFRQAARDSLVVYTHVLNQGFVPAAHHRLLIEHLEAVERGDIMALMVCMPPGAAKSIYCSIIFPAWFLGRHPEAALLAASNNHDLAASFGLRARNLFKSAEHQAVFPVPMSPDSQASGSWATVDGGVYYAAGVGSAIAGRRADLGLIDDPVKSREEADSDRIREKQWQWYLNDFLPRLKPGARRVCISTRWHEDDLAGRILLAEERDWTLLKLPMIAGNADPLGRAPGERLWPDWFTDEMVERARRDVRVWNALYQQEPTGEDGDYFKREWFRVLEAEDKPGQLDYYGASDYAVTEGGGDWTEHGIFGIDAWANIHIVDWWRGQTSPDEWIEAQADLIHRYKPQCWFGEAGVIRRSIEPFLMRRLEERRAFCRIEWLPSIADKATRCRPFQALAASGKVYVPYLAAWKADVLGQLLRFPAGMHDDVVDVCSLIGRGLEHMDAPDIAAINATRQMRAIVGTRGYKGRFRH